MRFVPILKGGAMARYLAWAQMGLTLTAAALLVSQPAWTGEMVLFCCRFPSAAPSTAPSTAGA